MANIISNDTITCSLPSMNGLPTFGEEGELMGYIVLSFLGDLRLQNRLDYYASIGLL